MIRGHIIALIVLLALVLLGVSAVSKLRHAV